MNVSKELLKTISWLNFELDKTRQELRDTKNMLLQTKGRDSITKNHWRSKAKSLEAQFDSQNKEIIRRENNLICFLSELIDLTPEMKAEEEFRQREQQKLETLCAELSQYKTWWRDESKRCKDLENALDLARSDRDDLATQIKELEMKTSTNGCKKNEQSPGLEDNQLLKEVQVRLETTAHEVAEIHNKLMNKEIDLECTNEELESSQKILKVTRDEKKTLEKKVKTYVHRVHLKNPTNALPTVIEDRRLPKNEPGRVNVWYEGSKEWNCSHLEAIDKLKKEINSKDEEFTNLEINNTKEMANLRQFLINKHTQEIQGVYEELNAKLNGTARLHNDCVEEIRALSKEKVSLHEQLRGFGMWATGGISITQPTQTSKRLNASVVVASNSSRKPVVVQQFVGARGKPYLDSYLLGNMI